MKNIKLITKLILMVAMMNVNVYATTYDHSFEEITTIIMDTDGDGIPDDVEGTEDPDGDGIPNFEDLDSDGDGILDEDETAADFDGDGIPNFLDLDSDWDFILDEQEMGFGVDEDLDGDGFDNYLDTDADGDNISDFSEWINDFDSDGIPNFLDTDSDWDFILDVDETDADDDSDGHRNFLDLDVDGDGIDDYFEWVNDYDNDGIPNYKDTDSDGDGMSDLVEGVDDFDADGHLNFLDPDSDNDGVIDGDDQCYLAPGEAPTGCPCELICRNVFWVHGYKGNDMSWKAAGDYTEETYKLNSRQIDYGDYQSSIEESAADVASDIDDIVNNQINTDQNIIIAHSLGGLVIREMGVPENANNDPMYNGFITFSSPHQGAYVAKALENDFEIIKDAVADMCKSLSAGPLAAEVEEFGIIGNMGIIYDILAPVVDIVCDNVAEPVVNSGVKFISEGIEEDITPEAASSIAPMAAAHNAVFYAREEDNDETLTARFLGGLMDDIPNRPVFTAGDVSDQVGLDFVNEGLTVYNDSYDEANSTFQYYHSKVKKPWKYLYPGGNVVYTVHLVKRNKAKKIRDAFKEGVDWYDRLNPTWKNIIGAKKYSETVITGCLCLKKWGGLKYSPGEANCDELADLPDIIKCWEIKKTIWIEKDSDGFILNESSSDAPGRTPEYEPQFMDGSNHMQMKNDENMEEAVKKIFELGTVGTFFITEERE